MPLELKQCPVCTKMFKPTWHGQIHCDKNCYAKSPKLKAAAKKSKLMELSYGNTWNKGTKRSEETRKLIAQNTPRKVAEENPKWKGDEVGYDALHDWVRRNKQFTGECEVCERKSENHRIIQAANISGEYQRDVEDFAWLCGKCHKLFDKLKKMGCYNVIGVEAKSNGYLDKKEKEMCKWLLQNKIFSKILIASKSKQRGKIDYKEIDLNKK